MESKEVVTDLNHRPVLTVETAFVLLAAVLVVITALPHAGLATALLAGAAVAGLLAKLIR